MAEAFRPDLLTQAVLLGEEWWASVARAPPGVDRQNERIVAFTMRQFLDLLKMSLQLNPEVINATGASEASISRPDCGTFCGIRRPSQAAL